MTCGGHDRSGGGRWRGGVALAVLLGACSSFDTAPLREPCEEGATVFCTCEDRRAGTTTCDADGQAGSCDCGPTADGSAAPAAGGGAGGTSAGPTQTSAPDAAVAVNAGTAAPPVPDAGTRPPDPVSTVDAGELPPAVDAGVGPVEPEAYAACEESVDCDDGLTCASFNFGGDAPSGQCTTSCFTGFECPSGSGGSGVSPTCFIGQCVLQCPLGSGCPDGMRCVIVPLPPAFTGFCVY